ncbi:MAG: Anaerobic sulfite reductase subunit B [Phycisphaerae bacterium]|nr:Anaerobic sulfite reductase subunit B [Phycisphaerae bacterium]
MRARDPETRRPADTTDFPYSIYLPEAARVLNVNPMTELDSLFELELESGRALGHAPGQFVQVSVFGFGECPISISSSPTRGPRFELSIRRVGEVTNALHRLRSGDSVGIRGPLGHGFDVRELHGHDMLVIAGGCALAPARSLIQYVLDERQRFGSFHVLYGARSPNELLFRDELARWGQRDDVHCHVIVDHADESWRGRAGVVTKLFDELPELDRERTMVAVIGPPIMFRFVMLEVLALGIPQNHVYCSIERRMKCGIGKCGHCQANDVYVCMEGPVFKYGRLKALREAIE